MSSSHYRILGVAPRASKAAIKTAYKQLAKKHHPDVNPSRTSAAMFQKIKAAHDVLTNDEKRRVYDEEELGGGQNEETLAGRARRNGAGAGGDYSDWLRPDRAGAGISPEEKMHARVRRKKAFFDHFGDGRYHHVTDADRREFEQGHVSQTFPQGEEKSSSSTSTYWHAAGEDPSKSDFGPNGGRGAAAAHQQTGGVLDMGSYFAYRTTIAKNLLCIVPFLALPVGVLSFLFYTALEKDNDSRVAKKLLGKKEPSAQVMYDPQGNAYAVNQAGHWHRVPSLNLDER